MAEQTEEIKEVAKIELPQKDYEILRRKANIYDLVCMRSAADRQIAQLEKELAEIGKK